MEYEDDRIMVSMMNMMTTMTTMVMMTATNDNEDDDAIDATAHDDDNEKEAKKVGTAIVLYLDCTQS